MFVKMLKRFLAFTLALVMLLNTTYAAAEMSFTKNWADSYNANEEIYITVAITEAEGVENFKLIPMITSGGVEISGTEM